MKEHVRLQRSHEEQCSGAGISHAQHAGCRGALKVIRDGGQGPARWTRFITRIERKNDRRSRPLMHVDGDVFADGLLQEWDGLPGQPSKNDSRIGGRIGGGQLQNELRWGHARGLHGLGEEGLLARRVSQQGRGRDAQLPGDVGKRGRLEALLGEDPSGGLQKLLALNGRRAAHL